MIERIQSEKIPKILFIRSVYVRDCQSDDIFEKKILENTIDTATPIANDILPIDDTAAFINYEKLPCIFDGIENWKKKTNLKCWNCTLPFDTTPIFIPKVIEPITIKNKIEREKMTKQQLSISVYGTFCSFGCGYFFIENHNYTISERIESINKLKLLHKLFYNTKLKETGYYPPPQLLKQYGGDLTIAEYQEEKEKHKRENITA